MSVTPDLIEWLITDQKVCQSWKKLGVRMGLSCYIGYIESQEKSNSASLRMLLRLWSSAKPECYNVKNLKRILAAEGLHHMWLWISLMTQRQSPGLVSKKIQETNSKTSSSSRTYSRSLSSNTTTSPWSRYLYTGDRDQGYTSDYYSSGEYYSDNSRSSSRLGQHNSGYTSCPTTPINNKKKFDFNFSPEQHNTMQEPRASRVSDTRASLRDTFLRSNSSSRVNDPIKSSRTPSANSVHNRSSSLSRLPKVSKLTSPKIVETEIWKKEIYKKVTEEYRDYSCPPSPQINPRLTKRAGSMPNLPNYVTSIDIQVVPSRTIKFPAKQNKQSEHEKEILKLCGDIITELKPSPININLDMDTADSNDQPSYSKINKVSIKHSKSQPSTNQKPEKQEVTDRSNVKLKSDKYVSVKNVQIEAEPEPEHEPIEIKVKHCAKKSAPELPHVKNEIVTTKINEEDLAQEQVRNEKFSEEFLHEGPRIGGGYFRSMIEEENRSKKYEIDDATSSVDNDSDSSSIISEVETVKSYNMDTGYRPSNMRSDSKFDVSKSDLGGRYFENLVNILQEAVNDISR